MDAVVSCEGVADDGDESGDRLGERSDTFSAIPCSSAPGSSDWHTPRHHHFTRARRPSPSKQHINEVKHEPMDASAAGLGLRKGGAAVAVAAAAASSAAAGQVAGGSLARTPMARLAVHDLSLLLFFAVVFSDWYEIWNTQFVHRN